MQRIERSPILIPSRKKIDELFIILQHPKSLMEKIPDLMSCIDKPTSFYTNLTPTRTRFKYFDNGYKAMLVKIKQSPDAPHSLEPFCKYTSKFKEIQSEIHACQYVAGIIKAIWSTLHEKDNKLTFNDFINENQPDHFKKPDNQRKRSRDSDSDSDNDDVSDQPQTKKRKITDNSSHLSAPTHGLFQSASSIGKNYLDAESNILSAYRLFKQNLPENAITMLELTQRMYPLILPQHIRMLTLKADCYLSLSTLSEENRNEYMEQAKTYLEEAIALGNRISDSNFQEKVLEKARSTLILIENDLSQAMDPVAPQLK